MQKIPDLEKLNLKDITSYGGAMEHGEDRAKKHDRAASLYNHVRSEPLASLLVINMLPLSSLLSGPMVAALGRSASYDGVGFSPLPFCPVRPPVRRAQQDAVQLENMCMTLI